MNNTQIDSISKQRLYSWRQRLNESHATPILLLGVGHDHKNGQIVICVTEDRSDSEIILFLEKALKELKGL